MLLDVTNKILFTSDLFVSFTNNADEVEDITLANALLMIGNEQIPDEEKEKN